jgi:hypothetical protein
MMYKKHHLSELERSLGYLRYLVSYCMTDKVSEVHNLKSTRKCDRETEIICHFVIPVRVGCLQGGSVLELPSIPSPP